jgi:hypothetical protein
MIELLEMAQLMHDDIIRKTGRYDDEPVIKIEISLLRAAAPARLLIAYGDTAEGEFVMNIEESDALMHEGARCFLLAQICGRDAPGRSLPGATRDSSETEHGTMGAAA